MFVGDRGVVSLEERRYSQKRGEGEKLYEQDRMGKKEGQDGCEIQREDQKRHICLPDFEMIQIIISSSLTLTLMTDYGNPAPFSLLELAGLGGWVCFQDDV